MTPWIAGSVVVLGVCIVVAWLISRMARFRA